MKLKIDDAYVSVGFFSFMKCWFISYLGFLALLATFFMAMILFFEVLG